MTTNTATITAEIARADNAIRSLTRALGAQRDALAALGEVDAAADPAFVADTREAMELSLYRVEALIRRETARRDAAELAQRAVAPVAQRDRKPKHPPVTYRVRH